MICSPLPCLELLPDKQVFIDKMNSLPGILGVEVSSTEMTKCGINGTHTDYVKVNGMEEHEYFHALEAVLTRIITSTKTVETSILIRMAIMNIRMNIFTKLMRTVTRMNMVIHTCMIMFTQACMRSVT